MSTEPRPRAGDDVPAVERLIELTLFAPLSLGARVLTEAPKAATRIRQDLATARFLGEMAVGQGVRRLRARVETATVDREGTVGDPAPTVAPTGVPTTSSDEAVGETDAHVPDVHGLALPDYEHLPAVDIVAALPTLTVAERDAIERYERAHRGRRTVLGKIDQLRRTA